MDADSRTIKQYPRRSLAWRVATFALMVYCFGLAMFALLPILPPPNPLQLVEIFIAITALSATFGLGLRLFLPSGARERWGRYSYLYAAVAGFGTFVGFNVGAAQAAISVRTSFGLFIMAGVFTSIGAHLEYGGERSIEDLLAGGLDD